MPPSLPPDCLIARLKPSRMSVPIAAPGPDRVDMKPMRKASAAAAGWAIVVAARRAAARQVERREVMDGLLKTFGRVGA